METDAEHRKELTFEQVQKIIDGQIAKIEEEERNRGIGENGNHTQGNEVSDSSKKKGLKMLIKNLFNSK